MAQLSQDCTSTEIESDSDLECPATKKLVLSSRDECVNAISIKNGNQLKENKINESSKHANSAGELSCNNSSSDDIDDGEIKMKKSMNVLTKIKVSPSSSIEIAKVQVASYPSTSVIKVESSHHDNDYLEFKVENKFIQSVYRQELTCSKRFAAAPKSIEWKDSGMSSCQESSQECLSSPSDEGFLVRSSSSTSTRSADSQNDYPLSQTSTQLPHDSDDETDSEGILSRVEEFTQERQEKMRQSDSSIRPTASEMSAISDDPASDINDSNLGMCRFCMVNPKNGVFVHNNCLHLCCCYKCAIKVWKKRKSCPICNCKIKNVTKLFVH
jgi:Zinc finger, C3HC4 type (RING finger)